jgi:hypothetical protein
MKRALIAAAAFGYCYLHHATALDYLRQAQSRVAAAQAVCDADPNAIAGPACLDLIPATGALIQTNQNPWLIFGRD